MEMQSSAGPGKAFSGTAWAPAASRPSQRPAGVPDHVDGWRGSPGNTTPTRALTASVSLREFSFMSRIFTLVHRIYSSSNDVSAFSLLVAFGSSGQGVAWCDSVLTITIHL